MLWLIGYHFKMPTPIVMLGHELEFPTKWDASYILMYEVEESGSTHDPILTPFFPPKVAKVGS